MNDKNRVQVSVNCSDCGATFETCILMGKQIAFSCNSCREARMRADQWQRQQTFELRVKAWRETWLSHIRAAPPRYRGFSWEDFAFDKGGGGNRGKVDAIREYAESFPVDRRPVGFPSMVLASSTNGVGKTMLASLVLETIYKLDFTQKLEKVKRQGKLA